MSDVMVYVQHLLGIGHVRRMALINQALRDRGISVTVASGGVPDDGLDFAASNVIQLSPCKTSDTGFSGLVDPDGNAVGDDWKQARKKQLLEAFRETAPKLLLIEMFPFGRRAFRFELIPLFNAAKEAGIPVICSVRDLLVRKKDIKKTEWMRDTARKYLDAVLVHGDPQLFGFDRSFEFTDDISDLITYTGYVAPTIDEALAVRGDAHRHGVLVSAGGGAVGAELIRLAIAARPFSQKYNDATWDIVTGPHFPSDQFEELRSQLPDGVVLHRFLSDFRERMAGAAVSVSQAGYNTLMDVLATRTPAVIVPFAEGGESEQTERAEVLSKEGVISLLDLDGLSAQSLAKQIDNARQPSGIKIALDGAEKTASIIADKIKGNS
ncbi:glycosyltransferase [Thalassospira sp.]|uniref:glycosyltransferase family protein n=1 Tax=Thalassospira sp. TaxID=1912094 RepID=UPI000C650B66|nr:glycosyltransferase [Thalassospira sp.]MBC06944.1 glycosyl transferase [Thalassospira sp.]|tara:strand:+ start:329 stop:1471 length:1143 start_codon:yes stop_codon:yes gene_type:complete